MAARTSTASARTIEETRCIEYEAGKSLRISVMVAADEFTYHGDELTVVPIGWPKVVPARASVLGGASWSFSPGSSRGDTYKGWISHEAKRAYVWWRAPGLADDLGVPDKYRPFASGPFGESERDSLRDALAFGWSQDVIMSDDSLPMPDEMTTGLFKENDFVVICKRVWPSKRIDDDDA